MNTNEGAMALTDNKSAAVAHFDSQLWRLGPIYWLATCNDGMRVPDDLDSDFDADCWEQAFGTEMPDWIESGEDLAGALVEDEKFGFLACVDIQQPRAVHKSGYSTNGWGCYWQHWVYAESVDDLYAKAKQAATDKIEKRLAKLRAEPRP